MKILCWVMGLFLSCAVSETAFAQAQRKAPEIKGKVWFNASSYKKISMKTLRGKVILVFFWTSNDINCGIAISYLNQWYSQYKDKGLEIIGVHTSEWAFNASESEVFNRIEALGIKFPVVLDNDSSMRAAYGQLPWPSFTLVDRGGYIRAQYSIFFKYSDIKIMLQTLLEEGESMMLFKRVHIYPVRDYKISNGVYQR